MNPSEERKVGIYLEEVIVLENWEREEDAGLGEEEVKPPSHITRKFRAVHNAFSVHYWVDETTRRLFELPEVRRKALWGTYPND